MRVLAPIIALALPFACNAADSASSYPSRPVRIIVNVAPGGGVDTVARIAAQHFNAVWNQPFIVDNRTGAGGSIANELVVKAAPDGYTLLTTSSTIVTTAAVRPQGYDPVRDLQAVIMITAAPYLLLVTPSLPVASVKDLIALAKTKPGTLSFASAGNGSVLHMGAELLVALSATRMVHVPFKGVAEAYPAVMSGDVNWMIGFPISAAPLVKAGRLKGIAVTSGARSRLLPELPTVAESGLPGYDVRGWFGMLAPARVPAEIIGKLNAEARRAFEAPEVVQRVNREGAEVVASSPEAFAREVRTEYAKWRELVKRQGLQL